MPAFIRRSTTGTTDSVELGRKNNGGVGKHTKRERDLALIKPKIDDKHEVDGGGGSDD